jgi:Cof subfamily protein (haloacid dehalogenase superfamily)
MTRPVRLIATDLDGTLLRSDRTVSERTRRAMVAAQGAGITVVVATARNPLTTKRFADQAGIAGLAICANGALVYDLARDEIIARTDLPGAVARAIIERLREQVPGICFAVAWGTQFACEPAYAAISGPEDHGWDLSAVPQGDALELLEVPLSKLVVRHPELTPAELHQYLTAAGLEGFEASLSGAPFVDVAAAGVSKAAALATICARLGIEREEVVAFGDAPNDLPMLAWAGRAIVVANAYPEVLTAISGRAASNNDDGVALAVEGLLAFAASHGRVR